MTKARYVCPSCSCRTDEMELLNEQYSIQSFQIKWAARFGPIFTEIGHELLQCKCGLKLNWFQMRKVEE